MSFLTAPSHRGLFEKLTAIVMCLALLGCGNPNSESQAQDNAGRTARYTVRGRVQELPRESAPTSQFLVRHEPIPSYMSSGKVIGMKSMTMPFPLAETVSLDGYAIEDVVELTFEVQYDPEKDFPLGYEIIMLRKLPPDTELIFEINDAGQEAIIDPSK